MADEADPTAEAPPSLSAAFGQKITESIQNMDIASLLQKMVATTPEDEDSEEVREKLKNVLEKLNQMSEEEREIFTKQVKDGIASKISMKLQDPNVVNFDGLEEAIKDAVISKLILVGVVGFILLLIIVFFGYKLFKSIKEKEKKKEEKKKAKMSKKKK